MARGLAGTSFERRDGKLAAGVQGARTGARSAMLYDVKQPRPGTIPWSDGVVTADPAIGLALGVVRRGLDEARANENAGAGLAALDFRYFMSQ